MNTLKASNDPLGTIAKVMHPDQPEHMRMYMPGFEGYFNRMPVLKDSDELLVGKVTYARTIMQVLGNAIRAAKQLIVRMPGMNDFARFILGIEDPHMFGDKVIKAGTEIILALWGEGFTSPIHGHASGYIHEELISGKIRINTYRKMPNGKARLLATRIFSKPGTIISQYFKSIPGEGAHEHLIHNFVALEPTVTLHYVTEHSLDGMGNTFEVEYWEDQYNMTIEDVKQISSSEGMYLQRGDVVMVRSTNVPEYGDHFIVVTGPPVMKEHGLRVQDEAIAISPNGINMLDLFEMKTGLILLKLNKRAKEDFLRFHEISLEDSRIVFAADTAEMLTA